MSPVSITRVLRSYSARPSSGTDRHIHITKSFSTCEKSVVMPLLIVSE
jgi:hypothetical protein